MSLDHVIELCDTLLHLGLVICNVQWIRETQFNVTQVISDHFTEEFEAALKDYYQDVSINCSLCSESRRCTKPSTKYKENTKLTELTSTSSIDDANRNVFPPLHPASIAYWLHTTGTTGEPSLVRAPHCCVVPNVVDLRKKFAMSPDDIIFNASPLTFDPSVVEVCGLYGYKF